MNEVDLGAKAFWLLMGVGVLSGIVSFWVFRRWSDTAKLRTAVNHIVAHLFELRLFADEPALVLRAQRDLLTANGELLRQVAVPSLLLVVPFSILLVTLDAFCGRAPLQPGEPTVITLQCGTPLPQAQLSTPPGIQVETPPVRVPLSSQISWRIRPLRAVDGNFQIHLNGRVITKSVSSTPGFQWLSASRAGSMAAFLLHPLEPPYSGSAVHSISVRYPSATIFNLNWLVWFLAGSLIGATFLAILN
ncbi:MAG: hypothetical protein M3Y57_11335 [Acidobacteriota bacterium]|nr:hypothetical protein [Acidobacteriota bacterium]